MFLHSIQSQEYPRRNNYPQAYYLSAGVIIIRAGAAAKISIKVRLTLKGSNAYAYTLPNAITYLNTCIPYLNTCITYPWLGFRLPILIHAFLSLTRLSAPYLNTCILDSAPYLNTLPIRLGSTLGSRQNRVLRHPSRQPIRIENPSTSSANQNQILRNPSRQPIWIQHYVTPESSLRHPRALG